MDTWGGTLMLMSWTDKNEAVGSAIGAGRTALMLAPFARPEPGNDYVAPIDEAGSVLPAAVRRGARDRRQGGCRASARLYVPTGDSAALPGGASRLSADGQAGGSPWRHDMRPRQRSELTAGRRSHRLRVVSGHGPLPDLLRPKLRRANRAGSLGSVVGLGLLVGWGETWTSSRSTSR
jgi:hypothetical protein